jgi:hypothetical protein
MIICHPLAAPWIARDMYGIRQGLKYWLLLLHRPLMHDPWYRLSSWRQFPWCGWKSFWEARPSR